MSGQNKTPDYPDLQDHKESHDPNMPFSMEYPLIETFLQIKEDFSWLHSSFTEQINELKRAIQELADSQQQQQQVPIVPPQSSDVQNES